MKKTLLAALAASLALGIAAPSFAASGDGGQAAGPRNGMDRGFRLARMMERFDANTDGVVTAQEVNDFQANIFQSVDADNSGSLTDEEFAMIGQMRKAEREAMREERSARREAMRDDDGDGRTERGKRGEGREYGMRQGKKGERGEGRHGGERREYGMRGERNGHGPRGPNLQTLDADNNGEVSLAEFQAGGEKLFARFDRNGDNQIDVTDFYRRNADANPDAN